MLRGTFAALEHAGRWARTLGFVCGGASGMYRKMVTFAGVLM